MVFADAISTARGFVEALYLVYLICIIAYIIASWIPLPYNTTLNRIQRFLYDVVDPYLRLFRRFIPQLNLGGLGPRPLADRGHHHAHDRLPADRLGPRQALTRAGVRSARRSFGPCR